jgi:hypothetical protein
MNHGRASSASPAPSTSPVGESPPFGAGPGQGARPPVPPSPALFSGELSPRDLAALAAASQLLCDAYMDGLIDGGPIIYRARCDELLDQARHAGIVPSEDEVDAALICLLVELGVVAP